MTRSFVCSFVFAAVAVCAMLAAPPASARSYGGVSLNPRGPITTTPDDPWGGVLVCTAHLRIQTSNGWEYHTASGYSPATCQDEAQRYLDLGYEANPNPGTGFCHCHPGFNGFMVAGPRGNGPLGVQNLTPDQVQRYDEGLLRLREKYQLDKFEEEHELLLQAIAPVESTPVEPDGR
jgi:hypothetical protein